MMATAGYERWVRLRASLPALHRRPFISSSSATLAARTPSESVSKATTDETALRSTNSCRFFDKTPIFWHGLRGCRRAVYLVLVFVMLGLAGCAGSNDNEASETPALALINPGDQTNIAGDAVTLGLRVAGSPATQLTYSAHNLPPGLRIDTATGVIAGQLSAADISGSPYAVDITATTPDTTTKTAITWTVLAPSQVSGRVIVPPHMVQETEPNHTLSQPQDLPVPCTLFGTASTAEASLTLPSTPAIAVVDLYRVRVTQSTRITLTIASATPNTNDLDLLLLDDTGHLLDLSESLHATELLETPGAGEYLVAIRAFRGASAYTLSVTPPADNPNTTTTTIAPGATFIPGEILVHMRPQSTDMHRAVSRVATRHGLHHGPSASPRISRMHLAPTSQPVVAEKFGAMARPARGDTTAMRRHMWEVIQALRADPDVAYAEPNYVRQPTALPNDVFFPAQWHHDMLQLPQAWDVSSGDDDVIVAVIDTGVLYAHPDLQGRLIAGYDFISDPVRANDGDGIDPDAQDAGDMPAGFTPSYHGTHVSGLLGAHTNNSIGVAGVTWRTRIMPLRVAGLGGATDMDIAEAIRYAVGLPNSSGTVPPEPARIINLSLAGPGFSQTLNDAIRAARAQGVMIVAAAGNEHTNTPYYPAAFSGVISVTAVDKSAQTAWYANTGSTIDVAAPGGDLDVDFDGDGALDGILSTSGDAIGAPGYRFAAGTSMAAPQVAGVLALMLAMQPDLRPADIDMLLAGRHPVTSQPMTVDLGAVGRDDRYGHGLLNAAAAVSIAQELAGQPTGAAVLAVAPAALQFASWQSQLTLDISNMGGGTLHIDDAASDAPWLHLAPPSGAAPLTMHASVDRTALPQGHYTATIRLASDATLGASTAAIPVLLEVGPTAVGDSGPITVLLLDGFTLDIVARLTTDAQSDYAFTTPPLAPGVYVMLAGTDRDADGKPCEIGDVCGLYPTPLSLSPGEHRTEVKPVVTSLSSGVLSLVAAGEGALFPTP